MNRRNFSKKLSKGLVLSSLALPLSGYYTISPMKRKKIKPKRLKKGDTIGLIAPGSPISEDQLLKALTTVELLGFKAFHTERILARNGYLAGPDHDRLADLHLMFQRPDIDGIWCIRGGYGCTRLLPNIDYKLIKKNPKVLLGYSDITALLQAIHRKTGLVCFHGPVGASEPSDYSIHNFRQMLMEHQMPFKIKNYAEHKISIIHPGQAEGELVGGNLTLLAAMAGTGYEICFKNKIVFLEDIGEKPYRIDRMLTQLRQAADLDAAAAILLGVFENCEGDEKSLSLEETLKDRVGDLGIPVLYGMSFGHMDYQMTLPVGIRVKIDTDSPQLSLLETAIR